jgi:hypothetical protein
MDINDLRDARAITVSPHGGFFELTHPDDLDALIASYGSIVVIGAVGFIERGCLTHNGVLLRITTAMVRTIGGSHLAAEIQDALRAEYRQLVSTDS